MGPAILGKRARELSADAAVSVQGVSKGFATQGQGHKGQVTQVLDDIDLDIRRGEFFSLLGPSGCGKTTLLRILAGFERPDSGTVLIGGRDMSNVPTHLRNVNTVFQNYALFPHLNVHDNVAFGLKMKGVPVTQQRERVAKALETVRIQEFAKRRPEQLSGGQRQRVALARAIVNEPEVLLLDEPLSALDLKLRKELQVELSNLQETLGITRLRDARSGGGAGHVRPDRGDEQRTGRATGPRRGTVRAPPHGLRRHVPGQQQSDSRHGAGPYAGGCGGANRHGPLTTRHASGLKPGQEVVLSIRPEKLRMERDDETEGNEVRARVDDIVYTGAENQYLLQASGQQLVVFQLNADIGADEDFDYDEEVALYLPPESLVVLDG